MLSVNIRETVECISRNLKIVLWRSIKGKFLQIPLQQCKKLTVVNYNKCLIMLIECLLISIRTVFIIYSSASKSSIYKHVPHWPLCRNSVVKCICYYILPKTSLWKMIAVDVLPTSVSEMIASNVLPARRELYIAEPLYRSPCKIVTIKFHASLCMIVYRDF